MSDKEPAMKSWIPEAEQTVHELWGKVDPHVIARIINTWNWRIKVIERGYKACDMLTGNSVIDRAFRLGLIDQSSMEELKKQERNRRRKARKDDKLVIVERCDGENVVGEIYSVQDWSPMHGVS